MLAKFQNVALFFLAALLWIVPLFSFALGTRTAWQGRPTATPLTYPGGDIDLQQRALEYSDFSKKIYPSKRLEQPGKNPPQRQTVYPPYALPMFGFFFGNWSFESARLVFQSTSFLALLVLMRFGWTSLRDRGAGAAFLGAAIPWAFAGNRVAMEVGSFAPICAALLALQFMAQAKGRGVLAGICWAFAMIKPQIALPFAILFFTERQIRGFVTGVLLLGALSLFALAWTGVGFVEILQDFFLRQKMNFVLADKFSAGVWIGVLGLDPRFTMFAATGLLVSAMIGAALLSRRWRIPFLPCAAICAVLGFVLLYHRRHDSIMLFPLALALLGLFFQRGFTKIEWIVFGAFFVSVFLPAGMIWGGTSHPGMAPAPSAATGGMPPLQFAGRAFQLLAPALAAVAFLISCWRYRKDRPVP